LDVIERDSDRDFFMGAEEAVKYGLIDRVLSSRAEAAGA
jgi:ATP-dependent Clp protease protease subunit